MSNEWLSNLKPGDQVIVEERSNISIRKVERLTKTQIVLEGTTTKFRRDSGRQVSGDTWHMQYLYEATPERVAEIRESNKRKRLISQLKDINWSAFSTEALEKVYKIAAKGV